MAIRIIVRRGPGAAPVFSLGTTEPVASNTGAGVLRAYPTIELNGDQTVTTPNGIVDRIINGRVTITGDGSIENCVIRGAATARTSSAELITTSGATSQAAIRFCDIAPQTPSAYWAGLGKKRFYAYRCKIWNCTDSFAAFASGDGICNVRIEGCYSPDMTRFAPDYANSNRAETHNDTIQLQGNVDDANDIVLIGNSFVARHSQTTGDLPTSHVQLSAVMVTAAVQPACSATFNQNWFRGGVFTFNAGGSGGMLVITNNRFERPGTVSPGPTTALSLNAAVGRSASGNTYIDNGAAVPITNG